MLMTRLLHILCVLWLCSGFAHHALAQSSNTPQTAPPISSENIDPATVPIGQITFYSHSFGENFPHAFVIVEELDALGQPVFDAFGFSAKHLSPKILFGRVDGHIAIPGPRYIRQSTPHFTLPITAQQKARVYAVRHRWSENRYHLNKHNCVHFIAELAQALGLRTNLDSEYFKEPKTFLEEVVYLNPIFQGSLQHLSYEGLE